MDHLNHMSSQLDGCITFYDDTETQLYSTDYVEIVSGMGCWSYLGRVTEWDSQKITLHRDYCLSRSIVQHEFMHALG